MPISGLVLTLSADRPAAESVLAALAARPEFTPGSRADRWLPVALDAPDAEASRAAHEWLRTVPGVEFVDVVHVNFEADAPPSSSAPFPALP